VIELRADRAAATIDERRGGRLASLRIGGRELIRGPYGPDDVSIRWGSYLMAPWAGRVAGGRFEWDGETIELRRTHGRHAIHGVTWDRAWDIERATATGASLRCDLASAGWPLGGLVHQGYRLEPDGLTMDAEIVAARPMPAALGWHPWFLRGHDPRLTVASSEHLETDRLLPTGRRLPVAGRTDLRDGPRLGRRRLDHVYVDVVPPAVVRWSALELAIGFGGPLSVVVVHTPPSAFCVEPQTAWPNAIRLAAAGVVGTGLVRLEPGERLRASSTWRWRELVEAR
jgi:aldose 1-epimerase